MKCRLPENRLLLLHRRSLFVIEVITANHLSSLNFAAKKGKVRLSCNDSSTDQTVFFVFAWFQFLDQCWLFASKSCGFESLFTCPLFIFFMKAVPLLLRGDVLQLRG